MANLVETAKEAGNFQTLLKAIETAGLVDILKQPGPYTVFAPVDAAFDLLPGDNRESLLADRSKLKKVLTYHVVFGDVRSKDLVDLEEARTVEGSVLAIDTSKGYKVNQATVIQPDILVDNGVIHVIDSVLMPAIMSE
ncbi:MAG: fasciclin domain-containing protein [Oscillatoria sp. PMC 1051.18]|nr:fasciclin domain-containing protein [Oscillatoria sp. PMC 1050.18]MEC5029826.1 fasciclin domain-containing protein [Oscillatoria sp. PMC 1051.18]